MPMRLVGCVAVIYVYTIYDADMTSASLTTLRNQMFLIKRNVRRIRSDFIVFGKRHTTGKNYKPKGTYNVIFRTDYEF